ncbi:glycerate kinase, partial [Mycolicibacterium psychrotolerans]|uniref:glycerate kinase n=1 Tax=Mycolicibacterium psychrotolerans TaxID=216929 RepID=UPI0021F2592E
MTRTVLIAPDSFGDSLTAVQAAHCIETGWHAARGDDRLILAPQSDGGPGFVEVLAGRLGEMRTERVSGPLDAEVDARWVFDPSSPATAYLECAQACGLALLGGPPTVRTALDAAGAARRPADGAHRARRVPAPPRIPRAARRRVGLRGPARPRHG